MKKAIMVAMLFISLQAINISEINLVSYNDKKLNACVEELRDMQNKFYGVLYMGYLEQNQSKLAENALNKIQLYTPEEPEFEKFMIKIKKEFDESKDERFFVDLAKKIEARMQSQLKKCERIEEQIKKDNK